MSDEAAAFIGYSVLTIASGFIAWWMSGKPAIFCDRPPLTEANYIEEQLWKKSPEANCIFVRRLG